MIEQTNIQTIQNPLKGWRENLHQHTKGDKVIWALVVGLTLGSLLAVYSATGAGAEKK